MSKEAIGSRDKKRFDALREIGCIACYIQRSGHGGRVTIHHLVDNGYRKHSGGHQATIPLCTWHHQGEPMIDSTVRLMSELYGPSMALEKKHFDAKYGSQRELLARVNEMLES